MSVTEAVSAVVAAQKDLDEAGEALAAIALNLAGVLDGGQVALASAGIAKQLVEVLRMLSGEGEGNSELERLVAGLSAPLQFSKN